MSDLTIADFAPLKGQALAVTAGEAQLELQLSEVHSLPASVRPAGGFRLEFVGPPQPMLAQGIYQFALDPGPREIFIVPVGQDSQGIRYEAVFF